VIDRFWSKVDKSGDCWLWQGAIDQKYGRFWDGNRMWLAHRFAYQDVVGEESRDLDHRATCPKHCVNPGHLRPLEHKQNCENRAGPNRNNRGSGVRGVYWNNRKNKWQASVRHNWRNHSAGYYDTVEEAEAAVIAKRNELFTHNDMDRIG
jgi:hypothetical protein